MPANRIDAVGKAEKSRCSPMGGRKSFGLNLGTRSEDVSKGIVGVPSAYGEGLQLEPGCRATLARRSD
eukprot:3916482-Amphidinium_carterae.1